MSGVDCVQELVALPMPDLIETEIEFVVSTGIT
jgi:hypothetical protein